MSKDKFSDYTVSSMIPYVDMRMSSTAQQVEMLSRVTQQQMRILSEKVQEDIFLELMDRLEKRGIIPPSPKSAMQRVEDVYNAREYFRVTADTGTTRGDMAFWETTAGTIGSSVPYGSKPSPPKIKTVLDELRCDIEKWLEPIKCVKV